MSILVIDAQSGCSGDMFVAALSQLVNEIPNIENQLKDIPKHLGLAHVELQFSDVIRSSIACRKFDVYVEQEAHDHSHAHKHAPHQFGQHPQLGGHEHSHNHSHAHSHTHADHHHDHSHRSLSHIRSLIQQAHLSAGCKQRALDIFQKLGAVEAQAHGIPIDDVHFHEVGAIDSIIDIVATAYCLDILDVQTSYCSPICVGFGQVNTAHGKLPIPAPATEKLLHGFPSSPGDLPGEWCTPTGAAIIAHLQPSFQIPTLTITASAFGGGGKNPDTRPNALRLRLAQTGTAAQSNKDHISILQCNVDDMPPELLGHDFTHAALEHGARDITVRPLLMKKGRPGFLIEILCAEAEQQKLAEFLCTHTTTIGVRIVAAERYILKRRQGELQTIHGQLAAKFVTLPDGSERCLPEYEACAALAQKIGIPTLRVYQDALRAIS